MKKMIIVLEGEMHKEFKVNCAKDGRSMADVIRAFIIAFNNNQKKITKVILSEQNVSDHISKNVGRAVKMLGKS